MQYVIYFAVTTPLLLAWLFWQTAGVPPPPPMFHTFADTVHEEAMLKRQALAARESIVQAARAPAKQAPRQAQARGASPAHFDRTARADSSPDIRLR